MNDPFENLVFEGGGVKGIAYGGALQALDERGILQKIKRVAGTSSGAINATLLALNYSPKEVSDIVAGTNFNRFIDKEGWLLWHIKQFFSYYGWYSGNYFREWIGKIVAQKTGNSQTTFAQLKQMEGRGFRDLYIVTSNLSQQRPEIFSHETNADTPISEAVRMSMSIPLFFQSFRKSYNAGKEYDVMVDGGVTWNYAVNIFDHERFVSGKGMGEKVVYNTNAGYLFNHQTLGFRLDSKETQQFIKTDMSIVPAKINGIKDYAIALVTFMTETANNLHLHNCDWNRTIFIDTKDVNTTDFNLPREKAAQLIAGGRTGVEEYFAWRYTVADPVTGIVPLDAKLKA